MKKVLSIIFVILAVTDMGLAQGLTPLLSAIEQNNLQLKAARMTNASLITASRAENRLGDTSVEYSPFYQSGVDGTSSSELIVSQELDFPTLYAARSKANDLQAKELDWQYRILRRDILLEAKQLGIELCQNMQIQSLLQLRMATADSLLQAFEKRLSLGDASLLDINRIKMDRMSVSAEYIKNEARRTSLLADLQRLNGGQKTDSYFAELRNQPISMLETADEGFRPSLETYSAEASLKSSQQSVLMAQQNWAPKLTLGYRRNTELREASNGFLVGVAVPLFNNSGRVKAAKMQRSAAELNLSDAQVEQTMRHDNLIQQYQHYRLLLEAYDEPLMQQTLSLLHKAVMAGELSVIDYYTEADRIYSLLLERIDNETEYVMVLSELNRESL